MSLVIDRPKPEMRLETPHEYNRDICGQLPAFDFLEYQAGTKMAQLKDIQAEELNILAQGSIKIKIQCSLGESTLHEFHPGDVLRLGDIARIAKSDAGSPSSIRTMFLAEGNTRILRLKRFEIESMFGFDAKLKYKLMQEMMRKWHEALQNMQTQCSEIRNYIYS